MGTEGPWPYRSIFWALSAFSYYDTPVHRQGGHRCDEDNPR